MHERVSQLGGRLTVTSMPGSGTTVDLRLPMGETPIDAARTERTGA